LLDEADAMTKDAQLLDEADAMTKDAQFALHRGLSFSDLCNLFFFIHCLLCFVFLMLVYSAHHSGNMSETWE
jgi:hypothetical protein